MNRLVFGAGVLMLLPVFSGCGGKFYLTTPPEPAPTATPAPTAIAYPFNEAEGIATTVGTAIHMNTAPTKFRVALTDDIRTVANRKDDPANAYLLLILQKVNPGTAPAAGSAAASPAYVGGTRDVNYPYHLAGIIVPGAGGNVGAGLQDADEQQLLLEASTRMRLAISNWLITPPGAFPTPAPGAPRLPVSTATPIPTPTPTSRPGRGATTRVTPVTVLPSIINPDLLLDVDQDPQFPVDSQNRPLVQVFFNAATGSKTIARGTRLSLNRMLVRSGWAVVDLYSPTSFEQKVWILDEAYARNRRLGMWGMERNGKKLVLQQRVPASSPATGSPSSAGVKATKPGVPLSSATPVTSATQSPATLTPTVRPLPATIPRVVPKSGSKLQLGTTDKAVLPAPSAGIGTAPAPGAATGGTTNSATG